MGQSLSSQLASELGMLWTPLDTHVLGKPNGLEIFSGI